MLQNQYLLWLAVVVVAGCSTDVPATLVIANGNNPETSENSAEHDAGARLEAASPELVAAVEADDIVAVERLLKEGARWQGSSLWLTVCRSADPLIVQAFHEAGAKPKDNDATGTSAQETLKQRLSNIPVEREINEAVALSVRERCFDC